MLRALQCRSTIRYIHRIMTRLCLPRIGPIGFLWRGFSKTSWYHIIRPTREQNATLCTNSCSADNIQSSMYFSKPLIPELASEHCIVVLKCEKNEAILAGRVLWVFRQEPTMTEISDMKFVSAGKYRLNFTFIVNISLSGR